MSAKMGRPTDSTKEYMLRVRMNSEALKKMDKCCEIKKISRSELVRECIQEKYEKLKK